MTLSYYIRAYHGCPVDLMLFLQVNGCEWDEIESRLPVVEL